MGIVGLLLESYPTYKIVVCGHSLGAAMARITQYFFHSTEQFPNTKIEVYTYGEPRNGNKAYVDYMNNLEDMTARVVARYKSRNISRHLKILPVFFYCDSGLI